MAPWHAALKCGLRVWALTRGQRQLPAGVIGLVADRRDTHGFAKTLANAGVDWDLAVDCIAFGPQNTQQDLAASSGRANRKYLGRHFVLPAHMLLIHANTIG